MKTHMFSCDRVYEHVTTYSRQEGGHHMVFGLDHDTSPRIEVLCEEVENYPFKLEQASLLSSGGSYTLVPVGEGNYNEKEGDIFIEVRTYFKRHLPNYKVENVTLLGSHEESSSSYLIAILHTDGYIDIGGGEELRRLLNKNGQLLKLNIFDLKEEEAINEFEKGSAT